MDSPRVALRSGGTRPRILSAAPLPARRRSHRRILRPRSSARLPARAALSGTMMVQLAEKVVELEHWERGVAVTLRGEGGRALCAGADLQLAREHLKTAEDGQLMCRLMTDTLTRLRRLPLVSVALVEGIGAVGGGAELATACDFRIMESDATFRFVQVQMGVSPGWGGGARLAGIAGRRAALRLLAWAAPLSAADAVAAGVADVVCPPGGAEEAAASFLEGILRQPSFRAVRAVKAAVASADDVSVEARRAEARAFRETWGAPANRQSLERSSGGTRRGAGAEKI
ncbi:unnamed protein product [Phaeothamnion confervicola]